LKIIPLSELFYNTNYLILVSFSHFLVFRITKSYAQEPVDTVDNFDLLDMFCDC